MRVVLLFPPFYSLQSLFKNTFEKQGVEVITTDFRELLNQTEKMFYKYLLSLPIKLNNKYMNLIGKRYLNFIKKYRPDFIILYNNGNLHPEVLTEIQKICPVYNYLGDYPLFLNSRYGLEIALQCDHVFCPDSYWIVQLQKMGQNRTSYLITGYDKKLNYKVPPNRSQLENYQSELLFIGRGYKDSPYGYKRAMFYNMFKDMDLKIYGREWEYWFRYFPNLKEKFVPLKNRLSFDDVNLICNCCKIYPIDLNPGLIHGLHIRIFDCIGSEILPIIEYSKDIDYVFKGVDLPVLKDYRDGPEIAKYYLDNEIEYRNTIKKLKDFVDKNYSADLAISEILRIHHAR